MALRDRGGVATAGPVSSERTWGRTDRQLKDGHDNMTFEDV